MTFVKEEKITSDAIFEFTTLHTTCVGVPLTEYKYKVSTKALVVLYRK
jgi:hypothetical protein